jgi:4'-phosphopantetheinyl transferase
MPSSQLRLCELRDADLDSVPEALMSDVVHLWQRSLRTTEESIHACHELLLPEEREKAARYRVEGPRSNYILTRGTLRSLLSKYLVAPAREISFAYTEHGKPFLKNCGLHFNVSHTEGLALMAFVLNREIGVDVEMVRPQRDVKKIAERFFSDHERRSLRDITGDELHEAFFRCWTRKEAYIKAVGEGLSMPLHQFDVSIEPAPSEALIATRPDANAVRRWTIRNVTVASGYAAALAIEITTQ